MKINPSTELRASDYGLKTRGHRLFVLFFCLLSIVCSPSSVFATDWLENANGYARGMDQSKTSGRPLMLYFYTDWCPYCRKFEKNVLADASVKKALEGFVLVRIDPEKGSRENTIAADYRVDGYPTVLFLNSAKGGGAQDASGATRSAADFTRAAEHYLKKNGFSKASSSSPPPASAAAAKRPVVGPPDHTLYLKNGRKVEGVLVSQNSQGLKLAMEELGEVYFSKIEYDRLEKIKK